MNKQALISYAIAIPAGIVSFLLALNLRSVIMLAYQVSMTGKPMWAGSLINAISVIILMASWIAYIFYVQHYFEHKCLTRVEYNRGFLRLLLPVIILFTVCQAFFMLLS